MTDQPLTHTDEPTYYFAGGFGDDLKPSLDVVKYWSDGQQSLTLGTYDTLEAAFEAERELVALEDEQGLQAAMQQAERLAVTNRTIDPTRSDGRLFSEGPPDPFNTLRDAEIAGTEYTYDIVPQPQGTYELQSLKVWQVERGAGVQSLALGEYDRRADARTEQQLLRGIRETDGLTAEMRAIERTAVENGTLRTDRADPRLFTQGPSDPFITLRQQELDENFGYTFRAGPTLDDDTISESLDLVRVEREGTDYRFTAAEFMRVSPADGDYVIDAADHFNRMLSDEGPGPAAQAAATWARSHSATSDMHWREVNAARLDRRTLRDATLERAEIDISEDDTDRIPAVNADWDL